jgi:multisubunit Na+/H+ antiporter MnhG subunit
MRWGYKVNIMTAEFILEIKQFFGHSLAFHLFGLLFAPVLANLMILAVNAAQVTITKENCA